MAVIKNMFKIENYFELPYWKKNVSTEFKFCYFAKQKYTNIHFNNHKISALFSMIFIKRNFKNNHTINIKALEFNNYSSVTKFISVTILPLRRIYFLIQIFLP